MRRLKIIGGVLLVIIALNLTLYLAAERGLGRVMSHLEEQQVEHMLEMGSAVLHRSVDELGKAAEKLAINENGMYGAIDALKGYGSEVIRDLGVGLVLRTDAADELIDIISFDAQGQPGGADADELGGAFLRYAQLLDHRATNDQRRGFLQAQGDIYLVAAHSIVSELNQEHVGSLLAARKLDEHLIERLRIEGGHSFQVRLLVEGEEFVGRSTHHDNRRDGDPVDEGHHVDKGQTFQLEPDDERHLQGRLLLPDVLNRPLLELSAKFYRKIYVEGLEALDYVIRWNLLICLGFGIVICFSLEKAQRSSQRRLESEQRFGEMSREFKTILDGIPNPLALISRELYVIWANRAGALALKQVAPSVHGRYLVNVPYESLVEPDNCPVRRCFDSARAEEQMADLEDGRVLLLRAYPLIGRGGVVSEVIRLAFDITEEAELRRESEQNSRLASLGELAAGVAHEVNNPTGMLLVNLSLLSDIHMDLQPFLEQIHREQPDMMLAGLDYALLQKKLPYLLDEMVGAARRIKGLVEDLKGFMRPGMREPVEQVDLNAAAQVSVRLVEFQLNSATHNFVSEFADKLPCVMAHQSCLEQVIVNLLVNATQALSNPSQMIRIATWFDEAKGQVVVEVKDEGRGIAPKNLERVTDPFFTTRRNEGGTGLGLSLSSKIAQEYGGGLSIQSLLGQGTRIRLLLPVADEE